MILIGQFDSPFVRRVGVALTLQGIPFEHRPWSVFGDSERIRAINPLMRVPTMVLDDGEVLVDSDTMIDHIDHIVPREKALYPWEGPERRHHLRIAALGMGVAEKAVSLFYEKRMHETISTLWAERCATQVRGTLALLERERVAVSTPWWFGDSPGHADIAVASALGFINAAYIDLVDMSAYPALEFHSARAEALPVFQKIYQEFVPPT